jgi:hypothetical protein
LKFQWQRSDGLLNLDGTQGVAIIFNDIQHIFSLKKDSSEGKKGLSKIKKLHAVLLSIIFINAMHFLKQAIY